MSYVERNAILNRIAALEAERDQLREALEYISGYHAANEPAYAKETLTRLYGDRPACDCVPGNTDDCPLHGVAHTSSQCAAQED